MESNSDDGAMISGSHEAGSSDSTIEIKIETLHSRTYTLRVDRHITILALKEQIAAISGVPSQVLRLLYRRNALQNDQCLSAYNVEDGHSLHLVVGPQIPSSESLLNNPGTGSRGRSLRGSDVAPGAATRQREPLLPIAIFQLENQANMGSQMNPIIPAGPNQTITQGADSEADNDPDRPAPPSP